MPTILITGSNRGLGLEFVRQYAADGWQVHAACRSPEDAGELQRAATNSSSIAVHGLDVAHEPQIRALADQLRDEPIDVLINNAGVFASAGNSFGQVDKAAWLQALEINTIAPLLMAEAFLPHVERGELKTIVNVSSKVGSLDDNTRGGLYAYRSSKSAVNQVTKSLALDLEHQGIKAVALHPGWVRTDMGGPHALIDAPESVTGMRRVIASLSAEQSGAFLNYDGTTIPW
ncbi:MAG: SDR family oxidoreductase [Acidobacteriota bacterium]